MPMDIMSICIRERKILIAFEKVLYHFDMKVLPTIEPTTIELDNFTQTEVKKKLTFIWATYGPNGESYHYFR